MRVRVLRVHKEFLKDIDSGAIAEMLFMNLENVPSDEPPLIIEIVQRDNDDYAGLTLFQDELVNVIDRIRQYEAYSA